MSPSIISHVSIGTNHFPSAIAFYDRVLQVLECRRVMEHPGAVAWGHAFPEFWVQRPIDGRAANPGNGTHIGFIAPSRAAVEQFHAAGLAAGGSDEGAPGPRADYGPQYYGCFLRDLDGHKIEAAFWDESVVGGSAPKA